ncbi:MAG TPA: hypothetical protein VJ937_08605, partial [Salinivirga sp.]|uniref:hypothetical protein n=1 Tax=Salinivirga sp. TaxID=1970192 RepID=UPI002B4877CB
MKNTLEKYAEGLTTRLLQIPRESIKENYVFVIEDEKRNLQLKKAAHNFLLACVSIVSFLLISTFISSIYYKGLIPFVFTLISFTLFLLIFFWLHEKSNPNKDIKKYDQLL